MTATDVGPVEETRVQLDPWPDVTAHDAQVLQNAQVPYTNLAHNSVMAKRAREFFQAAVAKSDADTSQWRETCRWIDWLFRANSLRPEANIRSSHVPEILKAHRALVPRVVEAFYGNGRRWFMARGRDRSDRLRDQAITSFHEFQCDQNNFRALLIAFVDSLCKYQVGIFKVSFESKEKNIWTHWIEKETGPEGQPIDVHKRQRRKLATFFGNKIRVCNPQRMILDVARWDPNEMSFIGDRFKQPLHEVIQNKRYKNLEELIALKEGGEGVTDAPIMPDQSARTGMSNEARENERNLRHGVQWVDMGELWCWLNFAPDGAPVDLREAVMTIAENSVVLEVKENFHDKKHHPYCVGRTSENGFEFLGVGLYDPALRSQQEYDHLRSTVAEAGDVSIGPRVFIESSMTGSDVPANLYDAPPGAIFKGCGKVAFQAPPANMQHAPFLDMLYRRDIEEITGVPRIWQGGEGGPTGETTATEINRKIAEGNRRLLHIVGAVEMACEQMHRKMHSNNGQFITDKVTFRVLDKAAARLFGADEYTIHPNDLLGDVDFSFHGAIRLQSYGLRGTNLLTLLQSTLPLIQENPGLVNVGALFKQVYRSLVGEEAEDEILVRTLDVDDLEDQTSENRRLRFGMAVAVNELDDDMEHLRDMRAQGMFELLENPNTNEAVKRATYEHIQRHINQARKKMAQAKALQQQQQRQQMMMPPGQRQEAGADQAPPAGGLERGARQTNGTGTPQQVGRAGRQGPIPQSRNDAA